MTIWRNHEVTSNLQPWIFITFAKKKGRSPWNLNLVSAVYLLMKSRRMIYEPQLLPTPRSKIMDIPPQSTPFYKIYNPQKCHQPSISEGYTPEHHPITKLRKIIVPFELLHPSSPVSNFYPISTRVHHSTLI